jgi:hypothetical protein
MTPTTSTEFNALTRSAMLSKTCRLLSLTNSSQSNIQNLPEPRRGHENAHRNLLIAGEIKGWGVLKPAARSEHPWPLVAVADDPIRLPLDRARAWWASAHARPRLIRLHLRDWQRALCEPAILGGDLEAWIKSTHQDAQALTSLCVILEPTDLTGHYRCRLIRRHIKRDLRADKPSHREAASQMNLTSNLNAEQLRQSGRSAACASSKLIHPRSIDYDSLVIHRDTLRRQRHRSAKAFQPWWDRLGGLHMNQGERQAFEKRADAHTRRNLTKQIRLERRRTKVSKDIEHEARRHSESSHRSTVRTRTDVA